MVGPLVVGEDPTLRGGAGRVLSPLGDEEIRPYLWQKLVFTSNLWLLHNTLGNATVCLSHWKEMTNKGPRCAQLGM